MRQLIYSSMTSVLNNSCVRNVRNKGSYKSSKVLTISFMLAFLFTLSVKGWSQSLYIELVPTSASYSEGIEYTFWVNYHTDSQVSSTPPGTVQDFQWTIPGNDDVIESTTTKLRVKFYGSGPHDLMLSVDVEGYGFYWGEYEVNVEGPPTPTATFSTTQSCGSTAVSRSVNGSPNYDWYWQTSSSGTSTSLGNASSITLTTSGPLYLRTRLNAYPNTWSDASEFAGNITVNPLPGAPSTQDGIRCGAGSLAVSGTPASGANNLRWYDAGGSFLSPGTSYSINTSTTTTYYASSYNTSSGCESSSRTAATATIVQTNVPAGTIIAPSLVASGTGTNIDVTGSAGTPRFWIYNNNGTNPVDENFYFGVPFSYSFPSPDYWVIKTRPELGGLSGCLGDNEASKTIQVIANPPVDPSTTFTISQNCNSTTVTRNMSVPSPGVDWYWQTSSTGTSTSLGNASSITISSDTPLYLRSRLSIEPYSWSNNSLFVGNISVLTTPSAPVTQDNSICGSGQITLTATPPNGAGVKWYTSSGAYLNFTGTSYSVTLSTTTTYYVSSYNAACESSSRTPVTATVVQQNVSAGNIVAPTLVASGTNIQIDVAGSAGTPRFWIYNNNGTNPVDENFYLAVPFSYNFPSPDYWIIKTRPELGGLSGCLGDNEASTTIQVIANPPAAPSTTFTISQNCNSTSVARNTAFPSVGVEWYWQTSSTGTSTSLGNATSITVSSDTPLYLRSRLSIEPYSWSDNSLFVGNIVVLTTPPAPVAQDNAICGPGQIMITATKPTGADDMRWYASSSGGTVLSTGTSYTVTLNTTATYYVSSYNAACESSTRTPVTATIVQTNVLAGTIVTDYDRICSSQSVQIDVTGSTGTPRFSVFKDEGNGVLTQYDDNFYFSLPFSYNFPGPGYWLIKTRPELGGISGCLGDNESSKYVQVDASPDMPSSSYHDPVCRGNSVTLQQSPGTNGDVCLWYTSSAGGTPYQGNDFPTPAITTDTQFWVSSYNLTSYCESERLQVDIITVDPPTAPVTSTDGYGVTDSTTPVTLSVDPVSGATGYHWYTSPVDGSYASDADGYTYSPSLSQTTDYWVASVWSFPSNACESSTRLKVTATVYPGPVITANNDGTITMGVPVTMNIGNLSYDSYQWLDPAGSAIAGATLSSYTTNLPGEYKVRVTKNGSSPYISIGKLIQVGPVAQNLNYIITNTVQVEGLNISDDVDLLPVESNSQTIQYFDGLGRPMQTVTTQGSPAKKDMVQPVEYDDFGRETKKYLPYISLQNNGLYKTNPVPEQSSFYNNLSDNIADDIMPFAQTVFEPSPLNRVVKQGAAGTDWQPDATDNYSSTDHTVKFSYETNGTDEVLLWTYTPPSPERPQGNVSAKDGSSLLYYDINRLYKTKTKDEQGHEVIEFKDKEGRVILKKVQANDTEWAQTYYIYDDFGNLVVVLPPEAVKQFLSEN